MGNKFLILVILLLLSAQVCSQNKRPEALAECYLGAWIPYQNLEIIGNQPFFGYAIGARQGIWAFQYSMDWKFLDAKNSYSYTYNDKENFTTTFDGMYAGFETSARVFSRDKINIDLLNGIGLDGFTLVKGSLFKWKKNISTYSYNVNFGIGYKLRQKSTDPRQKSMDTWGIQLRYNVVDYTLSSKTNLKGNYLTVRLTYNIFKLKK